MKDQFAESFDKLFFQHNLTYIEKKHLFSQIYQNLTLPKYKVLDITKYTQLLEKNLKFLSEIENKKYKVECLIDFMKFISNREETYEILSKDILIYKINKFIKEADELKLDCYVKNELLECRKKINNF